MSSADIKTQRTVNLSIRTPCCGETAHLLWRYESPPRYLTFTGVPCKACSKTYTVEIDSALTLTAQVVETDAHASRTETHFWAI